MTTKTKAKAKSMTITTREPRVNKAPGWGSDGVCVLPPHQAETYAGYAAHQRLGQDPCDGCTAEMSRSKRFGARRRGYIRKVLLDAYRNNYPEEYEGIESAAGQEFDETLSKRTGKGKRSK